MKTCCKKSIEIRKMILVSSPITPSEVLDLSDSCELFTATGDIDEWVEANVQDVGIYCTECSESWTVDQYKKEWKSERADDLIAQIEKRIATTSIDTLEDILTFLNHATTKKEEA